MPGLIYLCAGGCTFFPGAGLITLAVVIRIWWSGRWAVRAAVVTAILGIALVAVSAEAIPFWLDLGWGVSILGWGVVSLFQSTTAASIVTSLLLATFFLRRLRVRRSAISDAHQAATACLNHAAAPLLWL